MPTYSFRCVACGRIDEHVMSISAYVQAPPTFVCCATAMARHFDVVPGLAIGNALASERHYDGLRASDGSDISTRAKHRAYMKANNLTTVDDFSKTWKRDAQEREARMQGHDPSRAQDIAQAVQRLSST